VKIRFVFIDTAGLWENRMVSFRYVAQYIFYETDNVTGCNLMILNVNMFIFKNMLLNII